MNMMASIRFFRMAIAAVALLLAIPSSSHAAAGNDVQTIWRLLDYVAVDYPGAIANGRIVSVAEYDEMKEFSATVRSGIAALPQSPQQASLLAKADRLTNLVGAKGSPASVAQQARQLGADLLAAYPVPLGPSSLPDAARGAMLYSQKCSACHGSAGDGHGPMAASLDPPPIAFTDTDRARQRSLFALYQVISQGLDGTAMQSFAELPDDDRWALATHVGSLGFDKVKEGQRLWKSDPEVQKQIPDLKTFALVTPEELAVRIGRVRADAVIAYLRAEPSALRAASPTSLAVTRVNLARSLAAYAKGDRAEASRLALAAYLDGFEPVEPILSARDQLLMQRIEVAMGDYRSAIGRGVPGNELAGKAAVIEELLSDAEAVLSPDAASDSSSFMGALTILLREGLEALLIVVAMVAFLRKADRRDVLPYVHGGWIAALLAGALTWAIATYAIAISGASRELTEGFGSLFAALVLVSVGIWMHGKSHAQTWQRYIREALDKALSRRSAWFLFGLAFLVVYREVFETILFLAALGAQGSQGALAAGAATAVIILGVIAWAMLRYSRTLPIAKFFAYSSALMAVLAVILAGKGAAALQEAGIIDITPLIHAPRITVLGVYPTIQTIGLQLLVLLLLILGFVYNSRNHRALEPTAGDNEVTA